MRREKPGKPYVAAVVPAAGAAARMQGIDKQFEEVAGLPVIVRTLLALSDSDWIDEMVVVARADDLPDMLTLVRAYAIPKVRSVVAGGESRQQSVLLGIAAVSEGTDFVAIHDGARPLVSQRVIAETVIDAVRFGAAAAAVPVVDTIKVSDGEGMIARTPDRAALRAVQTPQVFALEKYRAAVDAANAAGEDYTDDCQMLEAVGQPVRLTPGDYANIKITTPVDLLVAQALAEQLEAAL